MKKRQKIRIKEFSHLTYNSANQRDSETRYIFDLLEISGVISGKDPCGTDDYIVRVDFKNGQTYNFRFEKDEESSARDDADTFANDLIEDWEEALGLITS